MLKVEESKFTLINNLVYLRHSRYVEACCMYFIEYMERKDPEALSDEEYPGPGEWSGSDEERARAKYKINGITESNETPTKGKVEEVEKPVEIEKPEEKLIPYDVLKNGE
jgi:hypothetical protein